MLVPLSLLQLSCKTDYHSHKPEPNFGQHSHMETDHTFRNGNAFIQYMWHKHKHLKTVAITAEEVLHHSGNILGLVCKESQQYNHHQLSQNENLENKDSCTT
jgi:hypothetical protein